MNLSTIFAFLWLTTACFVLVGLSVYVMVTDPPSRIFFGGIAGMGVTVWSLGVVLRS